MNRNRNQNAILVKAGDLYEINKIRYRVFYARNKHIGLIRMDRTEFMDCDAQAFIKNIAGGEYKKIDEPPDTRCPDLPPEYLEEVNRRAEVMAQVLNDMYPAWDRIAKRGIKVPCVHEAADTLGVTVKHFRLMFYDYLRSGLNKNNLIDARKLRKAKSLAPVPRTYRIGTDSTVVDRQEALEFAWQYFRNVPIVAGAYEEMLSEYYYSDPVAQDTEDGGIEYRPLLKEKPPDISTLYRYIEKRLPEGMTVAQYKAGSMDYQNNHRLQTGIQRSGLVSCGQLVQADECETDFELVDEEGHNIGKAIVYCFVDPYTQIIVAASIVLSNNSIDGVVNLFASMLEPHSNQSEPYGVTFTYCEFPYGFVPHEILCDQGSEYRSKLFAEICGELGSTVGLVPAGVGSKKGGVEMSFHRLQSRMKKDAYHDGVILASHRGVKDAKGNTGITMTDFRTLVYRYIKELNTSQLGPQYPVSSDAMEAGIDKVPSELWKFYTENKFFPNAVTDANRDQILFRILWRDMTFEIKNNGLVCKETGLVYFSGEEWFVRMVRSAGADFDVRYNKSDVSCVFVRYRDQIHRIGFSPERDDQISFKGWTWDAYLDAKKRYKKITDEGKKKSMDKRIETRILNKKTIEKAKAAHDGIVNNPKQIPESRAMERAKLETDPEDMRNRMLGSIPGEDADAGSPQPADAVPAGPEPDGAEAYKPRSYKDLLSVLTEDEDD